VFNRLILRDILQLHASTAVNRWDEKGRSPDGMLYAPKLSTRLKAQQIKETGNEED